MGIIEKLSGKRSDAPVGPEPAATGGIVKLDGRERVRKAAAELGKANECVADLEGRLNRLNTIISDADAAHAALQQAIAADGGVALETYGAGQASDQPIAALVGAMENTARAASAAKDALPSVTDMLSRARAEVVRLEGMKFDAMIVYLKTRAREEHNKYNAAFAELSRAYDALCGIAVAVSATGHADMMTTGLPVPIKAPGFNMSTGPAHGPSELVTLTHSVTEARIARSTAMWMQARERLERDPDADLDDLIGAKS
jgi:hypothetical protein